MSLIEFKSVSFKYPNTSNFILDNFNFQIQKKNNKNRLIVILGPSGCGKSTILRLISGLNMPISGSLYVLEQKVYRPSVTCGLIFQNYTCFDWLTVKDNVKFGLKLKGMGKNEADDLALYYLKIVDLIGFENYYPGQLSGGMKQRLAIARSLINKPSLLLMDEPFSALDHFTRLDMRDNLLRIWKQENINIIFVTHDISEAIYLADLIVILSLSPIKVFATHSLDFKNSMDVNSKLYDAEVINTGKIIQNQIRQIITQK